MLLQKRKQTASSIRGAAAPAFDAKEQLAALLVRWSFFNLLLIAMVGVVLRSLPFIAYFPLQYRHLLHGHSHFAFGGWVMPMLVALIIRTFPQLANVITYRHWRNIGALLLFSAYGMLLSFAMQGYKIVSIGFSTLSLAAGCYLAVLVWKALKWLPSNTAYRMLTWGLFYGMLAALGPFAIGPVVAVGYGGTPLYHDAIYFYLHFTYNGLFQFVALALWYKSSGINTSGNAQKVFVLLNTACVPAYALSILWNKPPLVFNWIGGAAGLLQLLALYYLLRDAQKLIQGKGVIRVLMRLACGSFALKVVLQALSALPQIAALAAIQRNLVIAYLHLVLVGFISLFMLALTMQLFRFRMTPNIKRGVALFLFCFVTTELLLVGSSLGLVMPFLAKWLAVLAAGTAIAVVMLQRAKLEQR